MIRLIPLALTAWLAACGVDGPPVPPSQVEDEAAPRTGPVISGSVGMGVSRTF
ncbi:hypothetical protein JSE7799_02477 [Jannaschia seosinensis]|uniref:Uncharacterized protein n=1 Tax=Jannaschia seosinensis TaxID=313367 RepID=A0A0M7BC33_9RHOB|nr:argininosuccinate lyase [Jannaschia seosinensis]CUH39749.1 hypothetical protein JSE7799_02477 [Jannaschia seosinensis]